jgi:hypothetical protein
VTVAVASRCGLDTTRTGDGDGILVLFSVSSLCYLFSTSLSLLLRPPSKTEKLSNYLPLEQTSTLILCTSVRYAPISYFSLF